jgi:hypothetical protein
MAGMQFFRHVYRPPDEPRDSQVRGGNWFLISDLCRESESALLGLIGGTRSGPTYHCGYLITAFPVTLTTLIFNLSTARC